MDETTGGPWYAVTPLRPSGQPPAAPGPSGRGADRFPLVRRFRELVAVDGAWLEARPAWRLRAEVAELLHLCGRVGLPDTGLGVVLEALARAEDLRADPSQHRTGTDAERRALDALDRLVVIVGERRTRPLQALTADDQEEITEAVRTVPAESVLGFVIPGEWPSELICRNAATTLLDGVDMPFLAVHRITQTAVFEPPDPHGVIAASRELRERWFSAEDDELPGLAAQSRTLLGDYIARAEPV